MNSFAYLFPGQGSQRVGMGRDLAVRYPESVGALFSEADEIMGFELSRLCWEGPESELRRTEITQPAIFLASLATFDVLTRQLPGPRVVAGHSLGEYAALVAAGVLAWTDALRLVRRRGLLMADVNETSPGAMAAVLGLRPATVERLCAAAQEGSGEIIEVANYNDDLQTVVSGTAAGVAYFRQLVAGTADEGSEYTRVVPLDVGAPFHCSLMSTMESEFTKDLQTVSFHDPLIPLVANATAHIITTGDEARSALRGQLSGPVRWRESLSVIAATGVTALVEVGPGRVLSGICTRTYPELASHSTSNLRYFDKAVAALA